MHKSKDKQVLEDLEGNKYIVSKDITIKQAIRILLSKQTMIA